MSNHHNGLASDGMSKVGDDESDDCEDWKEEEIKL